MSLSRTTPAELSLPFASKARTGDHEAERGAYQRKPEWIAFGGVLQPPCALFERPPFPLAYTSPEVWMILQIM
jgi:hypothetical protein